MITSNHTNFFICHSPIKTCGYSDCLKYLGIQFNPSGKVGACGDYLKTILHKIAAAPLKPHQKVFLATNYAIPKLMHQLILGRITKGLLGDFNLIVRHFVKSTLHLPMDTPNSFFYTKSKFGGLGIIDLMTSVPIIFLKRLRRMQGSTDPLNILVTNSPLLLVSINTCSNIFDNLPFGTDLEAAVIEYHRAAFYNTVDGGGLSQARTHSKGQQWVRGATNLLSPTNYVYSIKLRANRLPNKEVMLRGRDGDKSCRHCHRFTDTSNHLMQKCPTTHVIRIRRHDAIVDYLANLAVDQNHQVTPEWHFVTLQGTKKTDLVIVTPDYAIVCDVTITSDADRTLEKARADKISRYDIPEINQEILRHYPGRTVTHLPLIMTARGIYHNQNDLLLSRLRCLSHRDTLVARCVEGSVKIWEVFMNTVSIV